MDDARARMPRIDTEGDELVPWHALFLGAAIVAALSVAAIAGCLALTLAVLAT